MTTTGHIKTHLVVLMCWSNSSSRCSRCLRHNASWASGKFLFFFPFSYFSLLVLHLVYNHHTTTFNNNDHCIAISPLAPLRTSTFNKDLPCHIITMMTSTIHWSFTILLSVLQAPLLNHPMTTTTRMMTTTLPCHYQHPSALNLQPMKTHLAMSQRWRWWWLPLNTGTIHFYHHIATSPTQHHLKALPGQHRVTLWPWPPIATLPPVPSALYIQQRPTSPPLPWWQWQWPAPLNTSTTAK